MPKGTTRTQLAAGENRPLKQGLSSCAWVNKRFFRFPKPFRVSIERGRHHAFSAIGWPGMSCFALSGRAARRAILPATGLVIHRPDVNFGGFLLAKTVLAN